MAEKAKAKTSTSTSEGKVFTISLREAYKKSERKRSPYAVRLVKSELLKHNKNMQVKLGPKLNEAIWARGMKKPAAKVRVKAIEDGTVLKAELVGYDYHDFKAKPREEKKGAKEKLMERLGPKAAQKEAEEKMAEGKEKIEEKVEVKHDKQPNE